MLTPDDFRRIALGMDGAVEGAHMGHPDFRAFGRIFASIRTDHRAGMVALTPEQQAALVREAPRAFAPESGAWGRQGCTRVQFDAVDEDTLGEAMTLAWQNSAARAAVKRTAVTRKATVGKKAR
jgi:hypothetical protein